MNIASTSSLMDILRKYQLLSDKRLAELPALQQRFADAKALAAELIRRDWLTPYQANHLLQGKGQELVKGQYILLQRLGEGGMGEVFKVWHRRLDRICALKLIRQERLCHPDAVRRFHREIRAVAALSHPNIVLAYDADHIGDMHLLVMEFVDGAVDLAKLVKNKGPLPVQQACEYIRQAALGLQHAYERGMVHRDIKPANLLLTSDCRLVKILDMGLARLDPVNDDGRSSTMTQQGLVMGTPDYIAPEQAMNSHTVDIRADLYSLGCTFYYVLAGRPPFIGHSLMEKLLKHQTQEAPAIEQFRTDVPAGVAQVLRTLLAKKPQERYQTPAELASALAPWCSGAEGWQEPVTVIDQMLAVGTPPSTDTGPATTADTANSVFSYIARRDDTVCFQTGDSPPQTPPRRRRGLIAAAAVLLAGVLAVGGYCMLADDDEAPPPNPRGPAADVRPVKQKKPLGPLAKANALLRGKWYYIGPFDYPKDRTGFATAHPPEQQINLKASYPGKQKRLVRWTEYPHFDVGVNLDFLPLFDKNEEKNWACVYLYREIETAERTLLPLSLGSDDTLTLWLNGERLLARNTQRAIRVGDDFVTLPLRQGKNDLLIKVCQETKEWGLHVVPIVQEFFYQKPEFNDWQKLVEQMPAVAQVDAVARKLKELHPKFDGKVSHKIDHGAVTELRFCSDSVTDLSPVRALRALRTLDCAGSQWQKPAPLKSLAPLEGMPLTSLNCQFTVVADLWPVNTLPLTSLSIRNTMVADLTLLQRSHLQSLDCSSTRVTDLTPLQDVPLNRFSCDWSGVSDLTPLRSAPLQSLSCSRSAVVDLSVLQGGQLTSLACTSTTISDFSLLKTMPIKELWIDFKYRRDAEILRSIKTLTRINNNAAAPFWKAAQAQHDLFEMWREEVGELPAVEQVSAVAAKLQELNPTFDGKLTPTFEGDEVVGLQLATHKVTDLSPLCALPALRQLKCGGGSAGRSIVFDLSPLKDLPLEMLECHSSRVTNLTPLRDMPLKNLVCDFQLQRDAPILRDIATLVTINGKAAKIVLGN